VTEYLNYRAALKGVPHRRIEERVDDVKELCGLKEVEKRLIAVLSKGYRQRVGLADALVAEQICSSWTSRRSVSIRIRFGKCAS